MEFYIAKDKPISLYRNISGGNGFRESVDFLFFRHEDVIQRNIKNGGLIVNPTNQRFVQLNECLGLLKDGQLENNSKFECSQCGHDNAHQRMTRNGLDVKVSSNVAEASASSGGGASTSKDGVPLPLQVELSGHILKLLKVGFGDRIELGLEFEFQKQQTYVRTKLAKNSLFARSSKMSIETLTQFKDVCKGAMDLPASLKDDWLGGFFVGSKLSIVAFIKHKADDLLAENKPALDVEFEADVVIVYGKGEGQRVNCHSGLLIAQSEVLRSMLLSDMMESRSKEVLMDDMSLEAVNAFLGYLYYRGVVKAEKNCMLAVELIKAGNKYMVDSLEKTMKGIFMKQPYSWFDVDAALTLFLFANKVVDDDLTKKSIQVLKAKPRNDVESSAVFNKMFEENPTAAREIFKAVLWAS